MFARSCELASLISLFIWTTNESVSRSFKSPFLYPNWASPLIVFANSCALKFLLSSSSRIANILSANNFLNLVLSLS